jgi:YhcH/YjgK/YiaL family protein
MIYGPLKHLSDYFPKDSSLYKAVFFAQSLDPALPDGKYELDGERIFALLSSYETQPEAEGRFEAHRKYIDAQILLEGEEKIEATLSENLETLEDYSTAKDVVFFKPPVESASLAMRPGYFVVFFPHDIHRPRCRLYGTSKVRKVVAKIRVED